MTSTNPPNLHDITDRTTHDAAISAAEGKSPSSSSPQATIIYISSSSNPLCQRAQPKVVELAQANPHVAVHVMELNADTSPMIKFGPQNTPIFILMKGRWCETILGADWTRIEMLVKEKMAKDA